MAQFVGTLSRGPKGRGFHSQSGHLPRLPMDPIGVRMRRQPNQCFSLTSTFLHLPFLSLQKQWGKKSSGEDKKIIKNMTIFSLQLACTPHSLASLLSAPPHPLRWPWKKRSPHSSSTVALAYTCKAGFAGDDVSWAMFPASILGAPLTWGRRILT